MIKEAYCSFEVSKLLKEKGFGEECSYRYIAEPDYKTPEFVCSPIGNGSKYLYNAPSHQMAMAWLREVYNIHIEIYVIKNYDKKVCEYTYTIMDLNFPGSDDGIDCCNKYKTYEEACEAAIKYCLEKLI